MSKLKATQINVALNFENKLRDTIMYLIDKVEWPTFYIEVSKFADIFKKGIMNQRLGQFWIDGSKESKS